MKTVLGARPGHHNQTWVRSCFGFGFGFTKPKLLRHHYVVHHPSAFCTGAEWSILVLSFGKKWKFQDTLTDKIKTHVYLNMLRCGQLVLAAAVEI